MLNIINYNRYEFDCFGVFHVSVQRLVVKPDQLIKRRGKLGLVGVNLDLEGVKEWLKPRLMKDTMVMFALVSLALSLWKCVHCICCVHIFCSACLQFM